MKVQISSYFKYVGVLLCSALLLFSCSNSSNKEERAESQEAGSVEKSSGEDVIMVYQINYKGAEDM